jgi:hypothetical protein
MGKGKTFFKKQFTQKQTKSIINTVEIKTYKPFKKIKTKLDKYSL